MPLQPNRYGDTLPSMLTPGEVVLGPKEARQLGRPLLDVLGNRLGQATVGGRDDKFDEFGRRSFGLEDSDDWGQTPEQEELEELAGYDWGEDRSGYFGDDPIQSAEEAERQQAQGTGTFTPEMVEKPSLKELLTDLFGPVTQSVRQFPDDLWDEVKNIKDSVVKTVSDPLSFFKDMEGKPKVGATPEEAREARQLGQQNLFTWMGGLSPISPLMAVGRVGGQWEQGRLTDNRISETTRGRYNSVEEANAALKDASLSDRDYNALRESVEEAEAFAVDSMRKSAEADAVDREAIDAMHGGNDVSGYPSYRYPSSPVTPATPTVPSIEELIAQIAGNTVNPFGETEEGLAEFNDVIQSGVGRLFEQLGPNPSEQLVDATFNRPNVGDIILGQERGIRQGGFRDVLGEAFPGNAFGNIDDDIINSIVEERAGGQRNVFAGQQARGNFSPAGVLAANEDLISQIPGATERVREVGQNVVQGSQRDIDALRDIGTQRVQDFTLGQPDIDFSDLISQREGLIGERQGSLGSDISGALGSEPLFDINQALLSGGRSQGMVSGAQPNTLLDTIAERERRGTSTTDRRGLGTRGSGAF